MIHHVISDSDVNPADDPDLSNILCPVDAHVQGQNGHKIPLEMQLFLLPMWSIRSEFLDLTIPLKQVVSRYLSIRDIMIGIDAAITKGRNATSPDLQFIFEEIMKLHKAYDSYTVKLLLIRKDLIRHLSFYSNNGDAIWDNISDLATTDEHACKVRAYCIKVSMTEYTKLEEQINEAIEDCGSIIKCAMKYLAQIIRMVPDIIVTSSSSIESNPIPDLNENSNQNS